MGNDPALAPMRASEQAAFASATTFGIQHHQVLSTAYDLDGGFERGRPEAVTKKCQLPFNFFG